MKEYRNMKVYEQSGYQYKATPMIMLKGKWLAELGFDMGMQIVVRCEDGRLTITPASEGDMQDLVENKKEPVSMVAESKTVYGKRGKSR